MGKLSTLHTSRGLGCSSATVRVTIAGDEDHRQANAFDLGYRRALMVFAEMGL
jgi:hypothetical protein